MLTVSAVILMLNRRSFLTISFILEMLSLVIEERWKPTRRSSSTSVRPTISRLCHSKTRDRDITASPDTFVNERKMSVADFPTFTRNSKLIRFWICSSGMIWTREVNLNNAHAWTMEKTPAKLVVFDEAISVDYGHTDIMALSVRDLSLVWIGSLFNSNTPRTPNGMRSGGSIILGGCTHEMHVERNAAIRGRILLSCLLAPTGGWDETGKI